MRGSTRNSTGDTPSVVSASISSLPCIVAMRAAKLAPVRPARTIAGENGVNSRADAMPRVCDVDAAPERFELHGATKARMAPIRKLTRPTMSSARLLDSASTSSISRPANLGAAGHEPREQQHHLSEEIHERAEVARAIHVE
jgi:hypothetical protein